MTQSQNVRTIPIGKVEATIIKMPKLALKTPLFRLTVSDLPHMKQASYHRAIYPVGIFLIEDNPDNILFLSELIK